MARPTKYSQETADAKSADDALQAFRAALCSPEVLEGARRWREIFRQIDEIDDSMNHPPHSRKVDHMDYPPLEETHARMIAEGQIILALAQISGTWSKVRFTMPEDTQRAFDSWLRFQCARVLPPLAEVIPDNGPPY